MLNNHGIMLKNYCSIFYIRKRSLVCNSTGPALMFNSGRNALFCQQENVQIFFFILPFSMKYLPQLPIRGAEVNLSSEVSWSGEKTVSFVVCTSNFIQLWLKNSGLNQISCLFPHPFFYLPAQPGQV